MSAFVRLEITAEEIADAMNEDGNFTKEVLQEIAERVDMGMMRDNAGDIAGQMKPQEAAFWVYAFASLSEAVKNGFNMANQEQI